MKRYWRRRKDKEVKSSFGFLFCLVLFLFLFASLLCFVFNFLLGGDAGLREGYGGIGGEQI